MKYFRLYLILILAVALFLRLYHIGFEDIWIDEATSLYYAQKPLFENIQWIASDAGLPLYNIILGNWITLFGISAVSVRLISSIAGVLAVLCIAFLGRQMYSDKVGLLSSALLAVSPLAIRYSQEARCYSLFLLISILSMYFFKKKGSEYLITTAALIYTHIFGFFVLAFQFLVSFFRKEKTGLQLIVMCTFLPWLPVLFAQASRVTAEFWIPKPTPADFLNTLVDFAGSVYLFAIFLILLVVLIWKKTKDIFTLSALLLIPMIIVYVYSNLFTPLFVTRYFIFALPVFLILFAKGIYEIDKKHISIIVLVAVLSLSFAQSLTELNENNKPDWKKTSDFIKENSKKGDALILQPIYQIEPFSYYFSPQCFTTNVYLCPKTDVHVFVASNVSDLQRFSKFLKSTVWLIQSITEDTTVYDDLASTRNLSQSQEFNWIKIYKFT